MGSSTGLKVKIGSTWGFGSGAAGASGLGVLSWGTSKPEPQDWVPSLDMRGRMKVAL